jgi:hypothetical protein
LPEGDYYISAYIDAAKYIDPLHEDSEASKKLADEADVTEDPSEPYMFFNAQRPLIIDHDHGLFDCSQLYNRTADLKSTPSEKCPINSMALTRPDGSILAWGPSELGGDAPAGEKFSKIIYAGTDFTALTEDGDAVSWGGSFEDRKYTSTSTSVQSIYSSPAGCHAAIDAKGAVTIWSADLDESSKYYQKGFRFYTPTMPIVKGGITFPKGVYTKVIHSSASAERGSCEFAALREDGVITYLTPRYTNYNVIQPDMNTSPFYKEFAKEGMTRREIYHAYRKWLVTPSIKYFEKMEFTNSDSSGYIDIMQVNMFGLVALHEDGSIHTRSTTISTLPAPSVGDYIGIFKSKAHGKYSAVKADGSIEVFNDNIYNWRLYSANVSLAWTHAINDYDNDDIDKRYYITDWGNEDWEKGLKKVYSDDEARFEIYDLDDYFLGGEISALDSEQINDISAQYIKENNITMAELQAMSSGQLSEVIGKALVDGALGEEPLVTVPFNCYNETGMVPKPQTSFNGLSMVCDLRDVPHQAIWSDKLISGKTYLGVTVIRQNQLKSVDWVHTDNNVFVTYDDVNGLSAPGYELVLPKKLNTFDYDNDNAKIYTGHNGFLAMDDMNGVTVWGAGRIQDEIKIVLEEQEKFGRTYDQLAVAYSDFAFYSKQDGTIFWKDDWSLCDNWLCRFNQGPASPGYIKVFTNISAFAALRADGSIVTWGKESNDQNCGARGGPTDKGYISIYSTQCSFTAIKADGTIATWGSFGDYEGPWPTRIDDRL